MVKIDEIYHYAFDRFTTCTDMKADKFLFYLMCKHFTYKILKKMTSRVSIVHFYSINIKNIEYLGRISAVYFQHATSVVSFLSLPMDALRIQASQMT